MPMFLLASYLKRKTNEGCFVLNLKVSANAIKAYLNGKSCSFHWLHILFLLVRVKLWPSSFHQIRNKGKDV